MRPLDTSGPAAPSGAFARFLLVVRSRSETYLLLAVGILLLDLLTGRFLLFPILFVIPVALSAWYCGSRLAYALAVLLPIGRMIIATYIDTPSTFEYIVANGLIRVAVLVFIAFLVSRTARQTRELQQRVDSLVTICAWSRTVEYEGEWISFEEYLQRRFNISTSHGISPEQAAKSFGKADDAGPVSSRGSTNTAE